MTGTTLERPDVAAYLAAVRSALADVPADERDDLLADVEASLLESDGETMTRPPEAFAAELREAAGLVASEPSPHRWVALLDRARMLTDRLRLRELSPLWWVVRAYVAVAFFSLASAGSIEPLGLGNSQTGFADTSLLLFLLAATASIWLGFRTRDGSENLRRTVLAANVLLVLALVPVVPNSLDGLRSASSVYVVEPPPGVSIDGVPVRNLYPYSRDGELLQDVLLYTEQGAPLELVTGTDDIDRRLLETTAGTLLFNSFPIRYYDPGTRVVGRPELGPPVGIPTVTTPALTLPAPTP